MDEFLKKFSMASLLGLFAFEALSYFKVLPFTADYGWVIIGGINLQAIVAGFATAWIFKKIKCPLRAGWAFFFMAVLVYMDNLGNTMRLFSTVYAYDRIAHFAGGIAFCSVPFALLYSLRRCGKIKTNLFHELAIGFCVSMTAAAFYEIQEYINDQLTGSHRIGAYPDTPDDLLFHFLGTMFAIFLIVNFFFFCKNKKDVHS